MVGEGNGNSACFSVNCIKVRTLFTGSNSDGNSRNKTELGIRVIRIPKEFPPLIVLFFNQRLS